jgi:hypothetical protein
MLDDALWASPCMLCGVVVLGEACNVDVAQLGVLTALGGLLSGNRHT